ncbi:MAG: hypothetical protein F6J92_40760 [Symploca sp. SIO1A3]|nr:hypothetical protein [Symploca sp. SIO2C1]NER52867.1 hypothetical protein [Symploca sp. SIO1A3]
MPATETFITLITTVADRIGMEQFELLMYETLFRLEDELGAEGVSTIVELFASFKTNINN